MEDLPKDITVLINQNLSIEETIALCKTSKKLNQICKNGKYNNFWRNKIALDFQTEYIGDNAYEEYKFLSRLARTPIFLVAPRHFFQTKLFYSLDLAILFIVNMLYIDYYNNTMQKKYYKDNEEIVRINNWRENSPEIFLDDDELAIHFENYRNEMKLSLEKFLVEMIPEKVYNWDHRFDITLSFVNIGSFEPPKREEIHYSD